MARPTKEKTVELNEEDKELVRRFEALKQASENRRRRASAHTEETVNEHSPRAVGNHIPTYIPRQKYTMPPLTSDFFGFPRDERYYLDTETVFFVGDLVVIYIYEQGNDRFAKAYPGYFRTAYRCFKPDECEVLALAIPASQYEGDSHDK